MSYIGNSPGVASQRVTTTLTATAGQTQFTTQSGYVLGYVDVYLNGAKLVNGSDFEAITGTYITLFTGATVGDVVELVSYVPRGLSDGYTKAEADAKFLDVGGDTASGSLALAAASLTGNLTLSGGTAGGVGYLNSSKVLTTDSGLTFDGNALTLGGNTPFIRANMSGTQSTRLGIQNSTTNGNTRFFLYPNGTGNISAINGWNNSNPAATDYQSFDLGVISTIDVRLSSNASGTASYLPLTFYNGGGEKMRLNSSGQVIIGSDVDYTSAKLYVDNVIHVNYSGEIGMRYNNSSSTENTGYWKGMTGTAPNAGGSARGLHLFNYDKDSDEGINFWTGRPGSATRLMRILANGNVGIGTDGPTTKLHIQSNNADPFNTVDTVLTLTQGGGNAGSGTQINFAQGANTNWIRSVVTGSNSAGGSALVFGTAAGVGVGTEAMRIASTGNVSVGTTLTSGYRGIFTSTSGGSVTNVLAVHNGNNYSSSGTGARLLFKLSNFEDAIEQNKYASIEGIGQSSYNEDTALVFRTQSTANRGNLPTEKMRIDYAGWVSFPNTSGFRISGIKASGFGYGPSSYGALVLGPPVGGESTTVCIGVDPIGNPSGSFTGNGAEVMFRNGVSFQTPNAANTSYHLNLLSFTDGNVGIGTRTAGAKLDIWGDMRLDSAGGTNRSLYFRNQGSGEGATIKSDKALSFYAGSGSGSPTLYMTIKEGGNIGIGTSDPGARLHTLGASYSSVSSGNTHVRLEGGGGNGIGVGTLDSSTSYATWIQSGYLPNFSLGSYPLILNPLGSGVSAGTTALAPTSATKLVVGGGTWNRPTYSSSLSASGNFMFNLWTHCGNSTFRAGTIKVLGTENQVNQTYAVYDFVMTRYVHDGSGAVNYYVRLTQRNRVQVNNGYGSVFLYLSNYASSWTTTDQSANNGTSSVSGSTSIFDIYARNEVGQACSVAISVEFMDI